MPSRLGEHAGVLDVETYAAGLDFELDAFQRDAMAHVQSGDSVVVAAPTGAGKTQVAEYAIRLAVAGGLRAVYTTPLKALSNQKFGDFSAEFDPGGVGLLTGDHSIRPDADVVVMTTEVLRNMLYARADRRGGTDADPFSDLGVVVLDEVHYLQDRYRGGVWEEIIIHLPAEIAVVALSATVSNVGEFADWMATVRGGTEAVIEHKRPVPLDHEYCVAYADTVRMEPTLTGSQRRLRPNRDILDLVSGRDGRSRRSAPGGGRRGLRIPRRGEMVRLLGRRDLLPLIYFIFSRQGCDRAVEQLLHDGVHLTTRDEARRIRAVVHEHLEALDDADLDALGFAPWLAGLEAGLASHHAGLVPAFREVVERLFAAGLVKVVFATETLSLGINMPARTVVIEKFTKFDGHDHHLLTPGQYTQLAGRAGRRGIDDWGYAVVAWSPHVDFEEVAAVVSARKYELNSSFRPTYNMAANLVARLDRDGAHHVVNSSFAQFQADKGVVRLEADAERRRQALASYAEKAESESGDAAERWKNRASRTRRELRSIEKRIERRTESLSRSFDAICGFLEDLGYMDGWQLTEKGQSLARIYGDQDLVAAEAMWAGIFDGLEPEELAAVASLLTFETRRDAWAEPLPEIAPVRSAADKLAAISDEILYSEEDRGLDPTRAVDPGFAARAFDWASGLELAAVLGDDMTGGDFVRNIKQLLDMLRQIADVARADGRESLARSARSAVNAMWRDVVSIDEVRE